MKTEKLLQKILAACAEKQIDLTIQQEGDKIEVDFYDEPPRYLRFNLPDFEDENVPIILSEWLKKIKTIPS